MGKDKKPRKRSAPRAAKNTAAAEPIEPQSESNEPTILAADTPPLPAPQSGNALVRQRAQQPVLFQVLQTVRVAVEALLDIADATAEAIKTQLERRTKEAGEQ